MAVALEQAVVLMEARQGMRKAAGSQRRPLIFQGRHARHGAIFIDRTDRRENRSATMKPCRGRLRRPSSGASWGF